MKSSKRYEAYCPLELSMEGDVRGLQVGTLQKDIHKVMVALDIHEQTVAEAIMGGLDHRQACAHFPSRLRIWYRSGLPKSDLYRFDQV